MTDATSPRQPWHGITALAIALGMLASIWFLTTPEGQHWLDDRLQPLGYGVLLVAAMWPVLFYGLAFLVLAFTISAGRRREPLRLGEVALAIVVSLFLHLGEKHPEDWSGLPRGLVLGTLVVFAVSFSVRRLVRLVSRTC